MTFLSLITLISFFLSGCFASCTDFEIADILKHGKEAEIEKFLLSHYEGLQQYDSAVELLGSEFSEYSSKMRSNHYLKSRKKPIPIQNNHGEITEFHYEVAIPLLLQRAEEGENASVHLRAFYNKDKELIRLRIQTTPY
ncbi:hypothetical protein G0Q06_13065 [Puniceicoccales bacterium CK1056]|uniref:Lipoprotein n=1 Tax=Oceanipulchritudo coccoides TaxID=2706888 RepID=A0A6B2M5D7_9BACT|nr:hypothetical protein [Oceanipulchritudo coccoides]NDV63389.1 hypothetical protein [Oceanipulchritudo coccoides]